MSFGNGNLVAIVFGMSFMGINVRKGESQVKKKAVGTITLS